MNASKRIRASAIGLLIDKQTKSSLQTSKKEMSSVHKHKSDLQESIQLKLQLHPLLPPPIRELAKSADHFIIMNETVHPRPAKQDREPRTVRHFSCCRSMRDCMVVMGSAISYQKPPSPASIRLEKQVRMLLVFSFEFVMVYPLNFIKPCSESSNLH